MENGNADDEYLATRNECDDTSVRIQYKARARKRLATDGSDCKTTAMMGKDQGRSILE